MYLKTGNVRTHQIRKHDILKEKIYLSLFEFFKESNRGPIVGEENEGFKIEKFVRCHKFGARKNESCQWKFDGIGLAPTISIFFEFWIFQVKLMRSALTSVASFFLISRVDFDSRVDASSGSTLVFGATLGGHWRGTVAGTAETVGSSGSQVIVFDWRSTTRFRLIVVFKVMWGVCTNTKRI